MGLGCGRALEEEQSSLNRLCIMWGRVIILVSSTILDGGLEHHYWWRHIAIMLFLPPQTTKYCATLVVP